jgi:hypothetical protein
MQAHPTIFKSSEIGTELSTYASVHKDALEKFEEAHDFSTSVRVSRSGHSTPGRRLSDTSRVSANKIRISIFSSVRSVNGAHGIRALDIAEVDYTETHLNTLMKVTRAISTIAMTLIKVKLGTEYSV